MTHAETFWKFMEVQCGFYVLFLECFLSILKSDEEKL